MSIKVALGMIIITFPNIYINHSRIIIFPVSYTHLTLPTIYSV